MLAIAAIVLIAATPGRTTARPTAQLTPIGTEACQNTAPTCETFDAIIFVHGIYGAEDTFRNSTTGFDWPREFPREIAGRRFDVFRLDYKSALLSWAKERNPSFESVAIEVFEVLKPLRKRKYRSIGFIAHSLGGNVVSTYIHDVKSTLGHPERAQHGYYITLGTPVIGADIASLGSSLKRFLRINDDLLTSLETNNLYLRMLQHFRDAENEKSARFKCRPVHLHAAYEEARVGPLRVVPASPASREISGMVASPIVSFPLDHIDLVKPRSAADPVYLWVLGRITDETQRLDKWDIEAAKRDANFRLCSDARYHGEP